MTAGSPDRPGVFPDYPAPVVRTADAESFRRYEANRMPRTNKVQRISEANTWLRGPTDPDWLYTYDACAVPLLAPEHAPRRLA
jgi:hypothetical protein